MGMAWWYGSDGCHGDDDDEMMVTMVEIGWWGVTMVRRLRRCGAAVAAVGRGWWYGSDGCRSDDDDEMMVTMVEIGWWGVTMVRRLRRWSVLVLVEESQSPGEGVKNEFTFMANTATDNLGINSHEVSIAELSALPSSLSEILDQRSSRSLLASDNDRPYAIYDKYKHNNIKFGNQSTTQYEHRRFLNLSSVNLTSHAIATMRSMGSRDEKDGDYKAKLLEKAPLLKPIHNQVY
ncbi:hypothetical protein Tco_0154392 [Tanacetum coccineum]